MLAERTEGPPGTLRRALDAARAELMAVAAERGAMTEERPLSYDETLRELHALIGRVVFVRLQPVGVVGVDRERLTVGRVERSRGVDRERAAAATPIAAPRPTRIPIVYQAPISRPV